MKIINFIKSLNIKRTNVISIIEELELSKTLVLQKLIKEDRTVNNFVNSKLYLILRANIIKDINRYEFYLKTVSNHKKVIPEEIFNLLLKEGKK